MAKWKSPGDHHPAGVAPAAPSRVSQGYFKVKGKPVSKLGLVMTKVSGFLFSICCRVTGKPGRRPVRILGCRYPDAAAFNEGCLSRMGFDKQILLLFARFS